ncbi:MAG: nucleoside triphosphate pyrophosphohydrolase [Actinobacteria bacterium]|nr:MAG: nucleoside triphosphate pyrophosphohydrolase [Actinomycetota bacterium]
MNGEPPDAKPIVVVVGLGPGGLDHVTEQTRNTLRRIPHRFLRTSVHPSASLVENATSFDHIYEEAATFEDVYAEIADALVLAATRHGEIVYAVPGSPLVLEQTVRHLRARDDIDCVVLPAMSFLDVVWASLGIDPIEAGVRLIDGHTFATSAAGETGPLLVAHTHANWVLSDIKLAVEGASGDEEVIILQALGTNNEQIVTTTWAELDRTIEADHLTSIYIPQLATSVGAGYVAFHDLARTLREQCPWDIEQTHQSLVPYLLEETYEVVDAVNDLDADDPSTDDDLIEELGDLLYQIELHATIAEQEGRFTIADVTTGIHEKLVRRHPHVFGDVTAHDSEEVLSNWEDIKRDEKGRTSIFEGIPRSMPSLSYGAKVGRKASKVGFDWPNVKGAFAKIDEESSELRAAMSGDDPDHTSEELGDLLFAVVNVARHLDIDPELALRAATDKFRTRFERVERLAIERTIDLKAADLSVLDALWDEVKLTSSNG